MTEDATAAVTHALGTIPAPSGGTLADAGLVRQVRVADGKARIWLELPAGAGSSHAKALHDTVEARIGALDGIGKVEVLITAEKESGDAAPSASSGPGPGPRPAPAGRGAIVLPGVTDIVAVASGKGGVGKSTVAVNLALALKAQGKSVGLLDADIYGPSVPRMLGLTRAPEADGKAKLSPAEAFGLKVMSIGLLVDTETPMIWRGPMVASALAQMLSDVDWGTLDILVVDMPPGTGDAQLTMAQRVPLSGAVIVSTPQEIALIDARKGLAMFQHVHVPVLGLVENMAWFEPPGGGARTYIFGQGGARATAARLGVSFLGEVPIEPRIREDCDAGTPTVTADPDGAAARPFVDIAARVAAKLGTLRRPPPRIVMA